MTGIHCRLALTEGEAVADVRIEADSSGTITAVGSGEPPRSGDLRLGLVLAGAVNAHSHAFHRALRGRTHGDGGDFWQWRARMYRVAASLDPGLYRELATAVFAEMLAAGYTSVGEFHYVHHRPDGTPYRDPNAFGRSLAEAARSCGIRLTLIDTCYLTSAPGAPLLPEQTRFGDGDPDRFLGRWGALADLSGDGVTIGAAIHSVRAVPPEAIARLVEGLPDDVPLHVHLSEQPAENEQSLAEYGATPARVLADSGALTPRLSVVHATHLIDDDIALLGGARVAAVFCPTTEADLGDGIGPARELADAGARIALGSDQNAVVDPFLEVRGLEGGERLRSRTRGRFSPGELDAARAAHGAAALGLAGGLRVDAVCDLVEVDDSSVRTVGVRPDQLVMAASAQDVLRVVVGGRLVAERGLLADGRDPARMLGSSLPALET